MTASSFFVFVIAKKTIDFATLGVVFASDGVIEVHSIKKQPLSRLLKIV